MSDEVTEARGLSVRVLYFAKSREVAGISEESMNMMPGSTTMDLLAHMVARHPGLKSVMTSCVLALNHEYLAVGEAAALKEGDEIAVIPPLSGG